MSDVVATFGHCNGTGTCGRGIREHSCSSCLEAHGYNGDGPLRLVICSVCDGTGKVRV